MKGKKKQKLLWNIVYKKNEPIVSVVRKQYKRNFKCHKNIKNISFYYKPRNPWF